MSPSTESVSQREYVATSLVRLIHQNDDLRAENRQLTCENTVLWDRVSELSELFTLTEIADLLLDFGWLPSTLTPLTVEVYNHCLDQPEWWENGVLTATGGEYVKLIDSAVLLTHKGRAHVFDGLIAE